MDNLDKLPQLVSAEELKNKLLFSVMVVSSQPYLKLLRLSLSLDYDKICIVSIKNLRVEFLLVISTGANEMPFFTKKYLDL